MQIPLVSFIENPLFNILRTFALGGACIYELRMFISIEEPILTALLNGLPENDVIASCIGTSVNPEIIHLIYSFMRTLHSEFESRSWKVIHFVIIYSNYFIISKSKNIFIVI
jgi:hypothetical protein